MSLQDYCTSTIRNNTTRLIRTLRRRIKRWLTPPSLHAVGFHGDRYLQELVASLMPSVQSFIETGTSVGTTLAYVASAYPHIPCLSCEPDRWSYRQARRHTKALPNAFIYNEESGDFLARIRLQRPDLFGQSALFWLDAHGRGFTWPLRNEIAFVTTHFEAAYILIDDFRVPGLANFGYDVYQDQECSFEYISDVLNPNHQYQLCYPSYTDHTSEYHPLRGWGLIEFGHSEDMRLALQLLHGVSCSDVRLK